MAVINQSPAWATPNNVAGPYYPGAQPGYFYDFCAAAAARYPSVDYWEIFNEPDNRGWTSAQVSEILIGAANAMVSANSHVKVIGIVCMQSFARKSAFVTPILNAIRGVTSIYGISFHDYARPYAPELVPSGRGGPILQQVSDSIAMMDAAGFTGQLFITEFGNPTSFVEDTRPSDYVSETDAALWLPRHCLIHASFPRVEASIQFQIFGASTPNLEEGGMGLIRGPNDRGGPNGNSAGPAGSLKPGYGTFQNVLNRLGGDFVSRTRISTGPLWKFRWDRADGSYVYAIWCTSGTVSAPITGLTATVKVTQNDGTTATVPTTGGNLTFTATPAPQYIEPI